MLKAWAKSLLFGGGLPLTFLLFVVVAYCFSRWRRSVSLIGAAGLLILSFIVWPGFTDFIAKPLLYKASQLDHPECLSDPLCQAEAIIIPSEELSPHGYLFEPTWWRVQKGVALWKNRKAPLVVVSGGLEKLDEPITGADIMAKEVMRLGVPKEVLLLERTALDTHENAIRTASLLKSRNITKVLLVTSRIHLPRAVATFRKSGLEVFAIAAEPKEIPIVTKKHPAWSNATAFYAVMNEYLGYLYYFLRGWV